MNGKEMTVALVALLLVIGLLASPVACTINKQQLIAEAIKGGADPIEAKCAIEDTGDSSRSSVLCMAKALSKK